MPFLEIHDLVSKEVISGYTGRALHTGTMTFMYWDVEEGAEMPVHSHLHEQIAHVLEGRFELVVDGVKKILEPGVVAVIPPHVPHSGRAVTACRLMDVFLPEREDYKFS
ncbi:MAG TPA: cupin domain-containing protein [Flavisolibacter sp.]|jgi:quercetin dioxygenase-like cupin family protein|nr:cupin domain-containing protein [Flavisolibacter sp.]